jgi:hypothetical protein
MGGQFINHAVVAKLGCEGSQSGELDKQDRAVSSVDVGYNKRQKYE